jgi:hypothetical protein
LFEEREEGLNWRLGVEVVVRAAVWRIFEEIFILVN